MKAGGISRKGLIALLMLLALMVTIPSVGCRLDSERGSSLNQAREAWKKISVGMSREEVRQLLSDAWHYDMCFADQDLFFFGSRDPTKAGVVYVDYNVTDENGHGVPTTERKMKPGWSTRVRNVYVLREEDMQYFDNCSSLDLQPRP